MKKLFAVLLTLAMLLGLAACGSSGNGGGEVTIVGTWEGTMDMGAMMGMLMQMDIEEPISLDMTFTFNEDGTYAVNMDEDSLNSAMDTLVDVVIDLLIEMYESQGVDINEMLAAEGMTMDDFTQEIMGSMDLEEMMGETETTGYYKYEDGKFYTAEDKEDLEGDLEALECTLVTLTSTTLTFTDIEQDGEKMSELMPDMFPMVFTRK